MWHLAIVSLSTRGTQRVAVVTRLGLLITPTTEVVSVRTRVLFARYAERTQDALVAFAASARNGDRRMNCIYTQDGPDWLQGCTGDALSDEEGMHWWKFCPTCGRPIALLYATDQQAIEQGELENLGIERMKEREGAA